MISVTSSKHLDNISGVLYRNKYYKTELESVKLEMRKLAFECGLPQEDLPKINLVDFLDGYLLANGIENMSRLK
jgi:hypothetical protein